VAAQNFVLARTEAAAIAVWGMAAFPEGFEFTMASFVREPRLAMRATPQFHLLHEVEIGGEVPPEFLRFGLMCSDGTKATNLQPGYTFGTEPPMPARVLLSEGASGRDQELLQRYWCWPLPPPGPITFVCEWPAFDIPLTEMVVDAAPILAAASQAEPIWPTT
jgi:hypothetical protein